MLDLKLALRFFSRDWRSGELRILIAALIIAIAGLTTITVVVDRVDRAMTKETSQILGADRVINSPRPVDANTLQQVDPFGLAQSNSIRFRTMVVANDAFQLTSVRAVDTHYPLAGELRITEQPFTTGQQTHGAPTAGTVWISSRLLHTLIITVGDQVEIGIKSFTVAGIIDTEPGNADFIEFAPSLIMSIEDVPATTVIQPGSRMTYRYDFAGSEAALVRFDAWSKTALDESERVLGAEENTPALKSALGRARNYLNLSSLLGLLLGSVAIAIASNRYVHRHFDQAALLRCMGLHQNRILLIYCLILGFATIAGTSIGVLLGYFMQQGIVITLGHLLPEIVPPPRLHAIVLAYASGCLMIAGFALPGLLRIRAVTPLRVLRNDLAPLSLNAWLIMSLAITALGCIMWWYAQDILLILIMLLGSIVLITVLTGAAQLILKTIQNITRHAPIAIRFGVGHLLRYKENTLIQTVAFSIILTLMLTILLMRNELVADWQQQLPEQAPNHFVVNLPPADTENFKKFLQTNSIPTADIYPMVRGRIVEINDQAIANVLGEDYEQKHNSVRRELNLTWAEELPDANQIIQGQWFTAASGNNDISIEEEMAEALNLRLGDKLTFHIGGLKTFGIVTSIRKIDWESFKPNFYVIFRPDILENYGATYITSFYLAAEKKPLLNTLLQQFPTVSILELDRIITQVRSVLQQASTAIEFVLVFVIAAGLAVLLATTYATLDEKIYEAGILRTLGAVKQFINRCILSQYWILAIMASILAVISAESIAFALYYFIFKIDVRIHLWLWWATPLLGTLLIVPTGLWGTRHIAKVSPSQILATNK